MNYQLTNFVNLSFAVTKEGMTKLPGGLNPSTALGPDELHPSPKGTGNGIRSGIHPSLPEAIDTGEVPKEWSLVNICPLIKKGDRSLASNSRHAFLVSFLNILYAQILWPILMNMLLSDRQHEFRKWHSCETQLTTVINDWAKILDKKDQVDTFILDFGKAFDTPSSP